MSPSGYAMSPNWQVPKIRGRRNRERGRVSAPATDDSLIQAADLHDVVVLAKLPRVE